MKRFSKEFFRKLYQKAMDDDVMGNAAQVGFYFIFALFPLLLFLMNLFGIVMNDRSDLREELFVLLGQVMPASAFDLVKSTLQEVTANAGGGKLAIGILVSLWSASAGVDNMRSTLNEVYNLEETRSWVRSRGGSVLMTLAIVLLIAAALTIMVYGPRWIIWAAPFGGMILSQVVSWAAVLGILLLCFAVIYNFAPNHQPFKWKWISPGAVIGVVLWIAVSQAFRVYLTFFDSYAATYGSLGAVIILLLWLYLTALVILLGGAVNAILDESSGVKKEAHDPEQEAEEQSGTGKEAKT